MYSPTISSKVSSRRLSRANSSNGRMKKPSPYESKTETNEFRSSSKQSAKHPFVQDSLSRILSPYRKYKKAEDFTGSNKASPERVPYTEVSSPLSVVTPKRMRPMSSGKIELSDGSGLSPNVTHHEFPSQGIVENSLRDSLVTLKAIMREYEDKLKEKKIMQKVVEQLKSQTEGMRGRKVNFAKNFENLHKERLYMTMSAQNKGNERVLMVKSATQLRDGVKSVSKGKLEKEIHTSFVRNVETTKMVQAEQEAITHLGNYIEEMRRQIRLAQREKEKLRCLLQASSKLLKNMEEKYPALVKERNTYVQHILSSNLAMENKGDV